MHAPVDEPSCSGFSDLDIHARIFSGLNIYTSKFLTLILMSGRVVVALSQAVEFLAQAGRIHYFTTCLSACLQVHGHCLFNRSDVWYLRVKLQVRRMMNLNRLRLYIGSQETLNYFLVQFKSIKLR
jgi:hypothetical protein